MPVSYSPTPVPTPTTPVGSPAQPVWPAPYTPTPTYTPAPAPVYNYPQPPPAGYTPPPTNTSPPPSNPTPVPTPTQPAPEGFDPKDPNATPPDGWWWDAADGWKAPDGGGVPSGPSQEELDGAYNPIFEYLNQAQSQLGGAYDRQLGLLMEQEAKRTGDLGLGFQNSQAQIGNLKQDAGQRKEDVITSSRRLYNELGMANRQRFGGASSAGDAANELQSIEMQRSMAGAQRGYETTMREIGTKEMEVNSQFEIAKNNLKMQVDQAKESAYSQFQQGLLDIANQRAQTESQKAQQKLQYLDQYKQQLFQIQLAEQQYQQQMDTWKQQQDYQFAQWKQQLDYTNNQAGSAVSNYNASTTTAPTTAYKTGATKSATQTAPTGYKTRDDLQGYAPGIYKDNEQIGSALTPIMY